MKRFSFFTLIFLSAFTKLAAFSGDTVIYDTIIYRHDFYFTVLGIGTKNAQVAAIGNIAPPDFKGVQTAGIFNIARGPVTGLQAAGVNNHAADSLTGVQLAGCLNTVNGNVFGLQAAGAFNIAMGNIYGAQLGGAFNIASGNVQGAQLAGGTNIAWGNVQKLQGAGGLNFARDLSGMQIAGGMNFVQGTMRGVQISGGINYARNVKGLQIGVINFADSVDGAMIGVLSFARHGYHKLELGWNETTPFNLAFYTGSRKFHNIINFGIDPRPRDLIWGFGYGVGTAIPLRPKFDLCVSTTAQHINKGYFSTSLSDLWKLGVSLDVRFAKNISASLGPSLNVFVTDLHPDNFETPVTGIAPYYFFTQTYSNRWNAKAWIGVNAAIRFY